MQDFIMWPYVLRAGARNDPSQGACAMDAINWLVHGRHGDAPECACPVITSFVTNGNDNMPDDVRQRLLPYLHRIAGSRSVEHEAARARILTLAAIRVFAPRALDEAGLYGYAQTLRSLPTSIDMNAAAKAASRVAAKAARLADAAARAAAFAEAAALAWAAEAAARAAARAAAAAAAWDDYFAVLDHALSAGPQGEPWSAGAVATGRSLFVSAGGVAEQLA